LDHYQTAYFSDVQPQIEVAEFVSAIPGGSPACVIPSIKRIEIDERQRNFPKLCCLLVLHELIHNKLLEKYGEVKSDTGPEFQLETERLVMEGAYFGLL
jgi:hypothetical protein